MIEKIYKTVDKIKTRETIYLIRDLPYQLDILYHQEGDKCFLRTKLIPLEEIKEDSYEMEKDPKTS